MIYVQYFASDIAINPPTTISQYAAACAAIQNVLLSLHAHGVGSKWATGSVIRTCAFRQLVNAQPTDRIAALIMVGGLNSASTYYTSSMEEQLTHIRRSRRRKVVDDLLTDLS
jgi:nitroreductase